MGGDDIDASLVLDRDGAIYVAAELERRLPRALEVGQLIKLDPSRADPYVWGIPVPQHRDDDRGGGMWATPALHRGVLYAPTQSGRLLAVDTATGAILWEEEIGLHVWSSPSVVDDTLIVAVGCFLGARLRAWDVSEPRAPKRLWDTPVPGAASSRPRRCGRGGSTWAPATATSWPAGIDATPASGAVGLPSGHRPTFARLRHR